MTARRMDESRPLFMARRILPYLELPQCLSWFAQRNGKAHPNASAASSQLKEPIK